MSFEVLNRTGFLFTETALIPPPILSAEYGAGYRSTSVLNGGLTLRTWNLKIDALPDNFNYLGQDPPSPTIALLLDDSSPLLLDNGSPLLLGGIQKPRGPDALIETGETRAFYLWNVFLRSKQAGDQPFWIEVSGVEPGLPSDRTRKYLVEFADPQLTYPILCAQIYSTGLQLRERRVRGVTSPI